MTPIQIEIAALADIKERRQFLKSISTSLKPLMAAGAFDTINEAISETIFKPQGHTTLKTYEQWKAEGKRVMKGEKALFIWGKPKYAEKVDESGETAEKFFPLCYLFSNLQVE